jgi:hypothetical protein
VAEDSEEELDEEDELASLAAELDVFATSVGAVKGAGPGSETFWKRTSSAVAVPTPAISSAAVAATTATTAAMAMTDFRPTG